MKVDALDETIELLQELNEVDRPISKSDLVSSLDIDSLDVLELMFQMGIDSEEAREGGSTLFENWEILP